MPPGSGLQIRPRVPRSPRSKECPREERPFERRDGFLLVRQAIWIQENPAAAAIPLMGRDSFVCLIRRRGNCGIAAMILLCAANSRMCLRFLDSQFVRATPGLGPFIGAAASRWRVTF